jgi:hypothetical protein
VRRRFNREDLLLSSAPFREKGQPHQFRWRVYENYEVVDPDERRSPSSSYLRAVSADIGDAYEPLVDVPYLFLEFARLGEQRPLTHTLNRWIEKYGLLGLHRYGSSVTGAPRYFRFNQMRTTTGPATEYSDQGGPEETLWKLWNEVEQANKVLTCWEAALSRDDEQLEQALFRRTPLAFIEGARRSYEARARKAGVSYTDILVHNAAYHALTSVQEVLEAFAYPYVASGSPRGNQIPDHLYSPEALSAAWWPRNLLGAMYLQMYWLMTSFADLSHCRYCGRIISYAPPIPAGENRKVRKPRKDKEFCDSRCRQNYHYHNRVKPAHQDERC